MVTIKEEEEVDHLIASVVVETHRPWTHAKKKLMFIAAGIGLLICLTFAILQLFHNHLHGGSDPVSVPFMKFTVLQYNIFGRPREVSFDGQEERLRRIPSQLKTFCEGNPRCTEIDVITLAEADNWNERRNMLTEFEKEGYLYATSILEDTDPFTSLISGGVLIVSKWPIVREAQHIYRNACHYSDCLAAKGVKYARINKTVNGTSKAFNVFATHMQAWSTPQGRDDREKQAAQMHAFMKAVEILPSEPVLFAGDFNTDNVSYPEEVTSLKQLLNANAPQEIGEQRFTSDPSTNLLVGRDGAASSNKCSTEYIESWGALVNHTYHPSMLTETLCHVTPSRSDVYVDLNELCFCPCCPHEWLDYVLWAAPPYQQPLHPPVVEVVPLKSSKFESKWTSSVSGTSIVLEDLSDHYPILAHFEFEFGPTPMTHLVGCANDQDCHFHEFHCYCNGPNCYYNGSYVNGRDFRYDHPVNKNCLYQVTAVDCVCGPT